MSQLPSARRVLIVGNSGSGKSTLAHALAAEHGIAHVDLDTLAWQPTQPPVRVPLEEAEVRLRAQLEDARGWVAEGCYADLLELLAGEASELVFLDLPVEVCQARARARPWEPHKYPSREAQDANLSMLLEWIAAYPGREGALGRASHLALYQAFEGDKRRVEQSQGALRVGKNRSESPP